MRNGLQSAVFSERSRVVSMTCSSYFVGHGRAILASELGAEDPFGLAPPDILERVLSGGHTPAADRPRTEPWPQVGIITEVPRDEQAFLVAVGREAEQISLQEGRADPYLAIE